MVTDATSRDIKAKDAVDAIRGNLTNAEIMKQFKISAQGFADLLRQLFEKGLIAEDDLISRGIRFRVVRKQMVPTPSQVQEPPSIEEPEDFLDTVELTELLSAKEFSSDLKKKTAQPEPVEEAEEASGKKGPSKKGRFPFANLFKKVR